MQQIVYSKLCYNEPQIVIYNLPKLGKGIYYLKIYGEDKYEMKKIIIH